MPRICQPASVKYLLKSDGQVGEVVRLPRHRDGGRIGGCRADVGDGYLLCVGEAGKGLPKTIGQQQRDEQNGQ